MNDVKMVEKIELFKQWFLNGGGKFGEYVELLQIAEHNISLRVARGQTLDPGSCIVTCPHALTLSDVNAREGNSPFVDCFLSSTREGVTAISGLNLFRMFLIEQWHLKTESFWWPYLAILPDPSLKYPFDTPLYYSADDVRWIHGTSLENSTRRIEDLWRDEHAKALEALPPDARNRYSWELYKWAATVITSRSFPGSALRLNPRLTDINSLGATSVLLPGLDLLNHSPTARVTWQWTEEACCIRPDRELSSGAEIFNNYAPKSNEELVMGYGFSLFKNPSDHCNLAFGSVAVARIKVVLHQKESAAAVDLLSQANDCSNRTTSEDTSTNALPVGVGWVRLLHVVQGHSKPSSSPPTYMFSPKFLEQASMAFSNARERFNGSFTDDIDFSTTSLSRSKLHTMCAITMMLQKQQTDIVIANSGLPAWPENERQFHAARYRRGQLLILRAVIQSIITNLRQLVGLDPLSPREKRIMRLEHILKAGPKEFLQDFRAALHAGIGTRSPEKIRQRNAVEASFTIWLYGLFLWTSSSLKSQCQRYSGLLLPDSIARWLAFIHETYRDDSGTSRQWAEATASEDEESLVTSCNGVIEAATAKNPQSLYSYPEADVHRLLWCLRVIREEGFMCPGLDGDAGDEGDELMLFLDDGDSSIATLE